MTAADHDVLNKLALFFFVVVLLFFLFYFLEKKKLSIRSFFYLEGLINVVC